MNTYVNYFVEANLSICFFLVLYLIFFRNETAFGFKRAFILLGLAASLLVPLLHWPNEDVHSLKELLNATWLSAVVVTGLLREDEIRVVSAWTYVYIIYGVGLLIFFALFMIQLGKLVNMIARSKKHVFGKFRLVETQEGQATFSFFNYIFIGEAAKLSDKEKQQVIHHERVHAQQYHSLDLLFINLLMVVFWFNPALRTYRKILIQLHEFEADARAVENSDENEYCSLLARVALQSADLRFANHFTNSLTIKRIHMIRTVKTKISNWKIIGVAAVATLFFYSITAEEVMAQATTTPQAEVSSSDEVFQQVDQVAEFHQEGMEEGMAGLGKFIGRNLRYPQVSREKKITGDVFVSFIVEKDGTVTETSVVKGADENLNAEAVRVVKLTTWSPAKHQSKIVRSKFVMPIRFRLD